MAFFSLSQYLHAAWELLFPRRCLICEHTLGEYEEYLCAPCLTHLPLCRLRGEAGNAVERLFYDLEATRRGSAYLSYRVDNAACRLIHHMKYHNRPDVGVELGRWIAYDLEHTDFFDDIDALVPVPLSQAKQRKRGYNQSERIAHGISSVTGIPVRTDFVARMINNPTQTSLTPDQRRRNVEGIFAVTDVEALRNVEKRNKTKQNRNHDGGKNCCENDKQNDSPNGSISNSRNFENSSENSSENSENRGKNDGKNSSKNNCEKTTQNPHLLLIDDVITTGFTLRSLAQTLMEAAPIHLSFLGAALAGQHFNIFKQGAS